jgi:hypothetical protein
LVAGAERTDIFSPGAIDYLFRCSEGIPRNINNLCDNAMLTGFAAGESTIGRAIIEEVAETFDMLPRSDRGRQMGEEREAQARIFTAAGRAELWNAGSGNAQHAAPQAASGNSASATSTTSPMHGAEPATSIATAPAANAPVTPNTDEIGAAFQQSGLLRNI